MALKSDLNKNPLSLSKGIFCILLINIMDIFQKVKLLNLPLGKYVVVGGGILEAYGIRDTKDVDIAVTEDVYDSLKKHGWVEIITSTGRKILQKDIYEVGINWTYGKYNPSLEHLINTAVLIQDIPFVNLSEIIAFKKEINRDKDRVDISLIKKYLKI